MFKRGNAEGSMTTVSPVPPPRLYVSNRKVHGLTGHPVGVVWFLAACFRELFLPIDLLTGRSFVNFRREDELPNWRDF